MAARSEKEADFRRGDLDNADVRSEYERGYRILVDFFNTYL